MCFKSNQRWCSNWELMKASAIQRKKECWSALTKGSCGGAKCGQRVWWIGWWRWFGWRERTCLKWRIKDDTGEVQEKKESKFWNFLTVSWFDSSFKMFKRFVFDTLKPNHCRLLGKGAKFGHAKQIKDYLFPFLLEERKGIKAHLMLTLGASFSL